MVVLSQSIYMSNYQVLNLVNFRGLVLGCVEASKQANSKPNFASKYSLELGSSLKALDKIYQIKHLLIPLRRSDLLHFDTFRHCSHFDTFRHCSTLLDNIHDLQNHIGENS